MRVKPLMTWKDVALETWYFSASSFEPAAWDRNISSFFLRALALRPKALIKWGTTVVLLASSLELNNLGISGLLDHFLSQHTRNPVPPISYWNSTGTHFFRAIRCFVAVVSFNFLWFLNNFSLRNLQKLYKRKLLPIFLLEQFLHEKTNLNFLTGWRH